ncbi:uncharacterized protein LOC131876516 [Cryptomeria japonica]|uniref:uncharacterized protein LOC131876516 n=1 Tax=Cryptomeria japonica TaxID=3369 RepID=UPI0027DA60EA|nr:uncharacterized protein LOC131876516 [Cryptomeria japonica]
MEDATMEDGELKQKEINVGSSEGYINDSRINTEEGFRDSTSKLKGLSDIEFEYERGSDDEPYLIDELENNDPRSISQSTNEETNFSLFNVYGPTKIEEKKRVWIEISNQFRKIDLEKAIVVVDFNALLYNEEKFGGLSMNARVMEDFRNFVSDNDLFDVVPKSGKFTWTNRRANFSRISERLDRIFVGSFWLRDFKGTPSYCFIKKMKYLKNKIKTWNEVSFKNIFAEKLRVEADLDRINNLVIEKGMSNEEYHAETSLKAELAEILLREEIFWRDKSKELWIDAEDSNSKFFHASLKAKRNKNRII